MQLHHTRYLKESNDSSVETSSYNQNSMNLRSSGSQGKGILLEPTLLVVPERAAPKSNAHLRLIAILEAHTLRVKLEHLHSISPLEFRNPFSSFVNFPSNIQSKYGREFHILVREP